MFDLYYFQDQISYNMNSLNNSFRALFSITFMEKKN